LKYERVEELAKEIESLRKRVEDVTKERDEYKRLYEFRGKVIKRPCIHCGYKPKVVKQALADKGE
jgi:hypothetical protein